MKIFNKDPSKPRILVAPLDWGLGHITRCIPIVNELLQLDCEVLIGTDKKGYFLLKKEFPNIVILRLKGYEIRYSRRYRGFFTQMALQIPKILFSIYSERKWLKETVKQYHIDAVISDNRFGLHSANLPCIFITHQLYVKTGNRFVEWIAQKINYFFISKYLNCWVPDFKTEGLAGKLSHPDRVPKNIVYTGPLSRFEPLPTVQKKYDLLISISGPEPQRTIFENIILSQLPTFTGKVLLVRGLPEEKRVKPATKDSIEIVNHLKGDELNKAFEQSKMIICRSGYTTIMDLAKLGKKAILIPTPGQKEQEYLAKYLFEKKYFYSLKQQHFSLEAALKEAADFPFANLGFSTTDYKKVVAQFVHSLKRPPSLET